jgi:opacity protein-like surface antigen
MMSQKTMVLFVVAAVFTSVSAFAATSHSAPMRTHQTSTFTSVHHAAESSHYNDDSNLLGFEGSLNLAMGSISAPAGAQANDSSSRLTFNSGAFYEHRFIPYFGFRVGVDFTQRGFKTSEGPLATDVNHSFSANYIEFPLLAKAQYKAGIVTPYFATGPFLGILVGKGRTDSANGQSVDVPLADGALNTVNFGWNFGGGLAFEIVRHFNIEIGARYSLGITNVQGNPNANVPGNPAVDTGSIRLSNLQFLSGMTVSI